MSELRRTSSATEFKNIEKQNDENSIRQTETPMGKGINVSYDNVHNDNKKIIIIRNAHTAYCDAPPINNLQAVNIYDIYKDASASDDAVKKDKGGVKTVEESAKRLFKHELSYSGWHTNLHKIFDKVHNSLKDFEQEVVFERNKVAVERLPCHIYFNESGIFGDRVSFNPGAIIKIKNGAQTFDPGPGGGDYRFPPNGDSLFFESSFMNMYGFPGNDNGNDDKGKWAWGCKWDGNKYVFQANINGYSNIDSIALAEENHYWTFGNATKNGILNTKSYNDKKYNDEGIDKIVACKALGDAMQNATYLVWFNLMSAYESVEQIYKEQGYTNGGGKYEESFDNNNKEKDAVKKWLTYNSIMMTSDETVHYRNKLFGLPSAFTGGKRESPEQKQMTLNVGKVFVPSTDPKQKLKFIVDMEAQSVIKELTAQKMNWRKMIIEHNDVKTIDGRLVFHFDNKFNTFNNNTKLSVVKVVEYVEEIITIIENIKKHIIGIIDKPEKKFGHESDEGKKSTRSIMKLVQNYIQDQICCPFVMVARTGWMIQEPHNYNPTYWDRITNENKGSISPEINELEGHNTRINALYDLIGKCITTYKEKALVPRASKRSKQIGGKTKKKTRKNRKQKKRKTRRKLYKGGFYGEKQTDKVNYDKKMTDNEKYILGLIHVNLDIIKEQIKIQIENDTEDKYDDDDIFNLEYGTYCNVLSYLNKNRNNVLLNKKVIDFKEKVEKSLLTVINTKNIYQFPDDAQMNSILQRFDREYYMFDSMFEHFKHVSNIEKIKINNDFKDEYKDKIETYSDSVSNIKTIAQLKQKKAQDKQTIAQHEQTNAQHEQTIAQLKQKKAQDKQTIAQLKQEKAQDEQTIVQLKQKNAEHERSIVIGNDAIGRLAEIVHHQQINSSSHNSRKTRKNTSPKLVANGSLKNQRLGSPLRANGSPKNQRLGSPLRAIGSPKNHNKKQRLDDL